MNSPAPAGEQLGGAKCFRYSQQGSLRKDPAGHKRNNRAQCEVTENKLRPTVSLSPSWALCIWPEEGSISGFKSLLKRYFIEN